MYSIAQHTVGSFIMGSESNDTMYDTTVRKYGCEWEVSICTTTCTIDKNAGKLNIKFDVFNQHNGYYHSDSKVTIHLPIIINSKSSYELNGSYNVRGKHISRFILNLHNTNDTLYKTIQVSKEITSPAFNLNTSIGDSINILKGNTLGVLDSGKTYIIDIEIGFRGQSGELSVFQSTGSLEIDIKPDNSACLPHKKIFLNYNELKLSELGNYNLLGQKVTNNISKGVYIFQNNKIVYLNK
jgi:hypothetical protein